MAYNKMFVSTKRIAIVRVVPAHSIRGRESRAALMHPCDGLVLQRDQTLELTTLFRQPSQIPPDESGNGRACLRRTDSGGVIHFIWHSYCDVCHMYTVRGWFRTVKTYLWSTRLLLGSVASPLLTA